MSKVSLKWRIIIPIALVILIGVGIMGTLISLRFADTTTDNIKNYLEAESYRYGNAIKADMEASFSGIKALSAVLANAAGTPEADRSDYLSIIQEINVTNKGFFGLWAVFEPNMWDGKDAEYVGKSLGDPANGRYTPNVFMMNGKPIIEWLTDYDTAEDNYYKQPTQGGGREVIQSPYMYPLGGQEFYVTTAAVPILKNGAVIGAAGADLNLDPISESLAKVKILETGYAALVDQNGILVHHPREGLRMQEVYPHIANEVGQALKNVYQTHEPQIIEAPSRATGISTLFVISPFTVAETGSSWAIILSVPMSEVMAPVYAGLYYDYRCWFNLDYSGHNHFVLHGFFRHQVPERNHLWPGRHLFTGKYGGRANFSLLSVTGGRGDGTGGFPGRDLGGFGRNVFHDQAECRQCHPNQ